MVVAASNSDIAVILIDSNKGVLEQTLRHSYISYHLGIRKFNIIINKIDTVAYSQQRFLTLKKTYLEKIKDFSLAEINFIPISAKYGDNIVNRSSNTSWYKGKTLIEYLLKSKKN